MKNRSLVITLTVAYAGLVCGAIALRSPANLLGSTLNFFTEPTAIEQLDSFDANDDAVPDFMNAERILEIFVSAPQWLTPLMGQPFMMPGMIRIDERFFTMPSDHTAAPAVSTEEDNPVFDTVEPLWTSDTIELSPQFEGGESPDEEDEDVPAPFLVPSISPSSSLPASLMMPTAPTTPTAPSSTPPAVTAPPSSTPPVTSAPPAVVPATATSTSTSTSSSVSTSTSSSVSTSSSSSSAVATEICTNGMDDDSDGADDCDDMDCMAHPSCTSSSDSSVTASVEVQCNDGSDNDSDGSMDCDDADCMSYPSCMTSTFSSEGF